MLFEYCDSARQIPNKNMCHENVQIGKWLKDQKAKITNNGKININHPIYTQLSTNERVRKFLVSCKK